MTARLRIRKTERGEEASFWCPGCKGPHSVPINTPNGWAYSGTPEMPSLHPSLSTTSGHYVPGWTGPECWCTYNKKQANPVSFTCSRCHLILTNGTLLYCNDTTHALKGMSVELPEFPESAIVDFT